MKKISGITILKYVVAVLIVAYTITLLVVSGGSNKPFEEVSKGVESSVNKEALKKLETQSLKRYYGLNGADYEGVTFYVSTSSMSAEELLLIKAKSEEQVNDIKEAIIDRKETRRQDFDGYAPNEVDLVDASVLQVRGKYVLFVISKDAAKYKKAFTDHL